MGRFRLRSGPEARLFRDRQRGAIRSAATAQSDALFTASILALHADTGRLAWYYQTTPGDHWDFDAVQKLILADLSVDGMTRHVIMQANKNGFFYVLDRQTG